MLQITIEPPEELWDERKQEFVSMKKTTLQLEHSLVSVSKWESKWKKPFLSNDHKTAEESIDYIRCMTITQNVSPDIYYFLSKENIKEINEYIEDPMTASSVPDQIQSGGRKEQPTAELIYYWMIAFNIPFECQKWHLNRLLMLIRICNFKNQPPKKYSKGELMRRNSALNDARRQKLHTKG